MEAVIQNTQTLATTPLRTDALAIAEAGYAAVHTGTALKQKVRLEGGALHVGGKTYPLLGRSVYYVGVGKCATVAAAAVEELFGDMLMGGIALDVSAHSEHPLTKIEPLVGTHPLPSDVNEAATKRILAFLSARSESDLVIMLISGGGSALLCSPDAPMTCADESAFFVELTSRGAPIQDINVVRRHLSHARGGGLAKAAYPAEVISLIVSDVPGNHLESVASGPSVRDESTAAEAMAVLTRYGLTLDANTALIETPKEEKYFERVSNILFLSSQDALARMEEEAKRRGYAAVIVSEQMAGEARELAHTITERLHAAAPQTALFYAGESTVTSHGSTGTGGRNQELALAALPGLQSGELVLPFASDGRDNTEHAGAIADETTRAHARAHELSVEEYLEAHRSYDFFKTTGDALLTGYTGSNVSDLIVALKT